MNNPLYPNLDTPNLLKCIEHARYGENLVVIDTEAIDAALAELAALKDFVKACKERMGRARKALEEASAARMKMVDQLCDIRDTLKDTRDKAIRDKAIRDKAISDILKKHSSLDLGK